MQGKEASKRSLQRKDSEKASFIKRLRNTPLDERLPKERNYSLLNVFNKNCLVLSENFDVTKKYNELIFICELEVNEFKIKSNITRVNSLLVLTLKKFKEKNFPTVLKYQTILIFFVSRSLSSEFICFKNMNLIIFKESI
ncbi:hypothetical protein BpHYR1_045544 [Brachionus plicatilis]|uniref:Uncharacterized protein n=1 Tax=Brachionus plicatilis TaxID=10195 RepID=A0A3M7Q768_BRAPC|nr:hypothetical protein BpHYR1_045544 [Brachionus plicatilis]